MTQSYKLKEFVTASTGINTSKLDKESSSNSEEIRIVTGQSINPYGLFEPGNTQSAWIESPAPIKHFLLDNDIVIQIRGNVFKAGLFQNSELHSKLNFVASSNFAILRIECGQFEPIKLEPEILVAYLNSTYFKNTIISQTRSNTMLITLKTLLEQSIPIPEKSEQKQLVNLFYNFAKLQKRTLDLFEQQAVVAESKLFDVLYQTNSCGEER